VRKTSNHSEILKKFGETVKNLRKLRNISQEELAFRAQLDRSYIGGIERGERNLSLLNIIRIADALEVPLPELFGNFQEKLCLPGKKNLKTS